MKKLKKLQLKKESVANLTPEQMVNLHGGNYLWDSRVTCLTDFNTGGCGTSKTCKAPICIPL